MKQLLGGYKSLVVTALALSAICFSTGCSMKHVISSSLADNMQVTLTNTTLLKLKARYASSFLCVGKTKIERPTDKLLLIQVYSQHPFFRLRETDEINVEVMIDDKVQAVAFGYPDNVIWRRNGKDEKPNLTRPQ